MTSEAPQDEAPKPAPPDPVDVSDEIPDRKASLSVPVILVLIAVFAIWCAFLIYCQYAGSL